MDVTGFCSLRGKRIFPSNDVTMTSEVGATYLKMSGAVLRNRGYLQWLSSSILSEVMVDHSFVRQKFGASET